MKSSTNENSLLLLGKRREKIDYLRELSHSSHILETKNNRLRFQRAREKYANLMMRKISRRDHTQAMAAVILTRNVIRCWGKSVGGV